MCLSTFSCKFVTEIHKNTCFYYLYNHKKVFDWMRFVLHDEVKPSVNHYVLYTYKFVV